MYEYGVIVSLVIGLGQLAKQVIPAKWIPAVTLVLGVIAGLVYLPHNSVQEGIFNGIVVALASNGLFDVTKMLHQE